MKTISVKAYLLKICLGISIFLLIVIPLSLIPFETTVVPEWKILVVDHNGTPLANINVHQYWQHYGLEEDEHYEVIKTDDKGVVILPRRTIKANLVQRIYGPVRQFLTLFIHASYSPSSMVQAFNNNMRGWLDYKRGKELEHTLVINRK